MPATPVRINLLDTDVSRSPYGRIFAWAITYGRYIMIGTEIVVLLAFISRFSLDRKLTDLKEEVTQKRAIIQANQSFESDIRSLQFQLTKIKDLFAEQRKPWDLFSRIQSYLPPDTVLESFELGGDKLSISAVSGSTEGFSIFLSRLQSDKTITAVDLGDATKEALTGIRFKLSAKIATAKPKGK